MFHGGRRGTAGLIVLRTGAQGKFLKRPDGRTAPLRTLKKSARHNTSLQHDDDDGDTPLTKAMVSQGA